MATTKDWWAPVWRGLVVDPEAKHYRRMKNAVWLLLHLTLHADRRSGELIRKGKTIAVEMGVSEKTIRKWLTTLRKHGYVETSSNGRALKIVINKWKTFGGYAEAGSQNATAIDSRVPQNGQSQRMQNTENPLQLSREMDLAASPNDITIKKETNNDTVDDQNSFDSEASSSNPKSLALELSKALHDPGGFPFYLSSARRHPEKLLRDTLAEAMNTPADKIKKSRGALFNYLIKRQAQSSTNSGV